MEKATKKKRVRSQDQLLASALGKLSEISSTEDNIKYYKKVLADYERMRARALNKLSSAERSALSAFLKAK